MTAPEQAKKIKTVLVCYTQATFDQFESPPDDEIEPVEEATRARQLPLLAENLIKVLQAAGCTAEIVRLPQRSFASRDISKAAFAWRLIDLKESNGQPIDMALCLDFPAWSLQHPNKCVWLTSLPNFIVRGRRLAPDDNQAKTIMGLLQAERLGLAESRRLLAGSRPVAEELARRGLQVEFNPLPVNLGLPATDLQWQNPIKRLLKLRDEA